MPVRRRHVVGERDRAGPGRLSPLEAPQHAGEPVTLAEATRIGEPAASGAPSRGTDAIAHATPRRTRELGGLRGARAIDPKLADQVRRAAQNVVLNCQEANRRSGKDRRDRFRWCLAESAKVTGGLDIAIAFGYLSHAQCAQALELADRVRAMSYRLCTTKRE